MSNEVNEFNNMNLKVYRNSDILKIAAFIPPCHKHLRLAIVTKDQVIVLHEATVAAIVRAYIDITTHPIRRAVEYTHVKLDKNAKKQGYAEDQLIEVNEAESTIIDKWGKVLKLEKCIDEKNR